VTKNGCLSREYNSDSEQKTLISPSNGAWSDQCHQIGGQKPDSPGLTPSGEIKENNAFMTFTN